MIKVKRKTEVNVNGHLFYFDRFHNLDMSRDLLEQTTNVAELENKINEKLVEQELNKINHSISQNTNSKINNTKVIEKSIFLNLLNWCSLNAKKFSSEELFLKNLDAEIKFKTLNKKNLKSLTAKQLTTFKDYWIPQ